MPNDAVGRTNPGLVYIAQSKFREAVNVLGEAIRINPSAAEALTSFSDMHTSD